jgi:hypothetical protein
VGKYEVSYWLEPIETIVVIIGANHNGKIIACFSKLVYLDEERIEKLLMLG